VFGSRPPNDETLIIENVSLLDAGLYKMVVTSACGNVTSTEVTLTVDGVTATPPAEPVTSDAFIGLGPNPTVQGARVAFALAREGRVEVRVHDVAGRLIRRLDLGPLQAGRHELAWDGRASDGHAARTGLYFVTLEIEGRLEGSKRLVVQRQGRGGWADAAPYLAGTPSDSHGLQGARWCCASGAVARGEHDGRRVRRWTTGPAASRT
jgi:hypothetical protein